MNYGETTRLTINLFLLFSTTDSDHIGDSVQVQAVQNKTQNALEEYTRTHHKQTPSRFGQLLVKLTTLGAVNNVVIEHVFFNRLLGGASIAGLVEDILRAKDLDSE